MINYILMAVLAIACGLTVGMVAKMVKDISKLEDIVANLGLNVIRGDRDLEEKIIGVREDMQVLRELVHTLDDKVDDIDTEKLENALNKKWEDAISTISNFDPFSAGEDK